MEKIILTLWKPAQPNAGQWRAVLLGLRDALAAAGGENIRVMLVDEAVASASAQRITNSTAPLDGMLSLWLDSASQWPAIKTIVAPLSSRLEAYLVVESEPYPEERQARSALYPGCRSASAHPA